jgi:hypothetical protein
VASSSSRIWEGVCWGSRVGVGGTQQRWSQAGSSVGVGVLLSVLQSTSKAWCSHKHVPPLTDR